VTISNICILPLYRMKQICSFLHCPIHCPPAHYSDMFVRFSQLFYPSRTDGCVSHCWTPWRSTTDWTSCSSSTTTPTTGMFYEVCWMVWGRLMLQLLVPTCTFCTYGWRFRAFVVLPILTHGAWLLLDTVVAVFCPLIQCVSSDLCFCTEMS